MAFNFFLLHGWMMWAAWTLFALAMIASNRWLKGSLPGTNMWIHRISGATILLITLVFAIWAWSKIQVVLKNDHSYFVLPVLFLVTPVAIGGVLTRSLLRRVRWNTRLVLRVKCAHRIFAYLTILSAYIGVYFGIKFLRTDEFELEKLQVSLFALVLLVCEATYQLFAQKEKALDGS